MVERPSPRGADPRPPQRAASPRSESLERAAMRMAELQDLLGDDLDAINEYDDPFYIPDADIPDGWAYQWKRYTTYNQEDPTYQTKLAQSGWQPVPADRHPNYMPQGYAGKAITREGMILMELPEAIAERRRLRMNAAARQQVAEKEQALTYAPRGQFDRLAGGKGDLRPGQAIRKEMGYIPIPKAPGNGIPVPE